MPINQRIPVCVTSSMTEVTIDSNFIGICNLTYNIIGRFQSKKCMLMRSK